MVNVDVNDMPSWLREGLDAEATDAVLNKRTEERHCWSVLANAKLLNNADSERLTVKTYNVSRSGFGLITRKELQQGDELEVTPMDDTGESVHVRVKYCIQTIQGYKVGCEYVTG